MVSVPQSIGRRMLATTLAAAMALLPTVALAQKTAQGGVNNPLQNIPVTGTAEDGQTFTGEFSIQRFQEVRGTIVAVGEISGKFSDGKPVIQQSVSWPVSTINGEVPGGTQASKGREMKTVPATWDPSKRPVIVQTQASCPVLELVLGPLHLDILGLVVDLNQVELEITAVPGAGNLLGNLLCGLLGILDPLGALDQILLLLNEIVNLLNGVINTTDLLP